MTKTYLRNHIYKILGNGYFILKIQNQYFKKKILIIGRVAKIYVYTNIILNKIHRLVLLVQIIIIYYLLR